MFDASENVRPPKPNSKRCKIRALERHTEIEAIVSQKLLERPHEFGAFANSSASPQNDRVGTFHAPPHVVGLEACLTDRHRGHV
jgi:hypothetical protein